MDGRFKGKAGGTGIRIHHLTRSLAVVAQIADRIVHAATVAMPAEPARHEILAEPADPYTAGLLAAAPDAAIGGEIGVAAPLLVRWSTASIAPVNQQSRPTTPVLRDVSLAIGASAALSVIGRSGWCRNAGARHLRPPAERVQHRDARRRGTRAVAPGSVASQEELRHHSDRLQT